MYVIDQLLIKYDLVALEADLYDIWKPVNRISDCYSQT